MKAYIGNYNFNGEMEIFCFSVESEEKLQLLKELIEILYKLGIFSYEILWIDFKYGESFLTKKDLINFIDRAVDISGNELAVFKKFKVSGVDIYDCLIQNLLDLCSDDLPYALTEDNINEVEQIFTKIYGKQMWEDDILSVYNRLKDSED